MFNNNEDEVPKAMRKMKNLWFAKLVVIVFLGIALAGLMTESASAIAAVQSAMYYGVLYFSFRQGAGSGAFAGVCVAREGELA